MIIMIILNLIRVLNYAKDHHQAVSFFPTNVMYFAVASAAKTMVKRKKLFTALLLLAGLLA